MRTTIATEVTPTTPAGPIETAARPTSKKNAARIGDLRPRVKVARVPQPSSPITGEAICAIRAIGRKLASYPKQEIGAAEDHCQPEEHRALSQIGIQPNDCQSPEAERQGSGQECAFRCLVHDSETSQRLEASSQRRTRLQGREHAGAPMAFGPGLSVQRLPASAAVTAVAAARRRRDYPDHRRAHQRGACPAPR